MQNCIAVANEIGSSALIVKVCICGYDDSYREDLYEPTHEENAEDTGDYNSRRMYQMDLQIQIGTTLIVKVLMYCKILVCWNCGVIDGGGTING